MVGPDLDIFSRVNHALEANSLPSLSLSEFLRLFNTMTFRKPFYCVDMKEMIELAEMVENADEDRSLTYAEIFGFACAPVNLGLMEHVQYYVWILNHYVTNQSIVNEDIDDKSDNIDYLETSIKCVELFQWLSRHFDGKNFEFNEKALLDNKSKAIERLNELLSDKIGKTCSSCGCKMPTSARFNICDDCFSKRKFNRRPSRPAQGAGGRDGGGRDGGGRDGGGRDGGGRDGGRSGGGRSRTRSGREKSSGSRDGERSPEANRPAPQHGTQKKSAPRENQEHKPRTESSSGSSSGASQSMRGEAPSTGIKRPVAKKNAAAAFRKHR